MNAESSHWKGFGSDEVIPGIHRENVQALTTQPALILDAMSNMSDHVA